MDPSRVGCYLRSALEPHGVGIRELVRARPGITVRELRQRVRPHQPRSPTLMNALRKA